MCGTLSLVDSVIISDQLISYFGSMAVKLGDIVKVFDSADKSGDCQEWLSKFETIAALKEIVELHKVVPLFLTGAAYAVYEQLSEAERSSYNGIKSALLTAFSADPFRAYAMLKERRLAPGEAVDVYLADVRKLVSLMRLPPTAGEPLVRCAFVEGLPSECRVQLMALVNAGEDGMSNLVARARAIMVAGASSSHPFTPLAAVAQRQQMSMPSRQEMPPRRRRPPVTCYRCQRTGHIARECRAPTPSAVSGNERWGAAAPPAASRST